jgi:hypothetical protein
VKAFFWASYIGLWVITTSLAAILLLALRYYGRRIMSVRERLSLAGLDLGSWAPPLEVDRGVANESLDLSSGGKPMTLLFSSAECSVCANLWTSIAEVAARRPEEDWIWIGTDDYTERERPFGWRVFVSGDSRAHRRYEVPAVPYAYHLDAQGRITAKGLVNTPVDLLQLANP